MSTMTATDAAKPRLSSEERRAQILEAAIAVFGAKGYVGTTTDDIARAASVSQPYVVRLFGSKERLFLDVLDDALGQLFAAFERAAAGNPDEPLEQRLGHEYIGLLQTRGLHQTLSHAFLLGAHPVIGPRARDGFARVWQYVRDLGMSAERAQEFIAQGMMLNTLIGLRMADDDGNDPRVTDLFTACFPTEKAVVLRLAPRVDEPW
ncbi:TetR/AcrR family transcriptional regulator [Microbacterium sp. cx-55]|uniref:TetR/AcrR family transcriptional regulator n=1 Tax=unclassified Microbacterium TaxID=2609290 RepID=UPI001CC159F5|nr:MULTISPECIES: TetR/AcrR family transcriptional regulator [unclassified Microbacterium]MBZ4486938.1 TetR/AcrR family transcriptional regulator [Microbacterium sp. cx-55]MCC4907995.1 TetR/AcrR family transcriptional regulator [Microbacterium sp. cx-59]UGB35859.1 TetR/AcrR family transcriptional regulator [Microbacterium sp. cx-55]